MIHSFDLKDAKGESHTYEVVPHPPSEGMDILWILMGLGGEPVARLAQSVIADALQGVGESDEKPMTVGPDGSVKPSIGFSRIMDKIDLEKVDFSGAARDLRLAMASLPMTELVHKLLKYTSRDGKSLAVTDSKKLNFDQAYTANYMELLTAVWRVVAANGFLPQIVTSVLG